MRRIALLVVVLALARSAPLMAQSAEAEVLQVVDRLFDGMRAADSAAVRSVLHPRARLVSTGSRDGSPEIQIIPIARFIDAVGGAQDKWDELIWDPEVRIDDNLATVWTQYDFHIADTFSHCGVDAFQLVRTTEGWRIISIVDTRRNEGCEGPPGPDKAPSRLR